MEIVERSKEDESLKFIRNLVNLKLHDPHQFRISISEVEQSQKTSMFQKIIQSIDKLLSMEYKVRNFNESILDYSNNINYVCLDNSNVEYMGQWEILKFWLNRVGLVSISNSIEKTIRTYKCKLLFNFRPF